MTFDGPNHRVEGLFLRCFQLEIKLKSEQIPVPKVGLLPNGDNDHGFFGRRTAKSLSDLGALLEISMNCSDNVGTWLMNG